MTSSPYTVICGDALHVLSMFPDDYVQCVVTSPPYWLQRSYCGDTGVGLEGSLEEYIAQLLLVFSQVKRVLRQDGTLWLNLGDLYAAPNNIVRMRRKQLVGLPWRVAFALQASGWFIRSDNIWYKPNAMPDSSADRPGRAHEYVFLLTKTAHYQYHRDAVQQAASDQTHTRGRGVNPKAAKYSLKHCDQVYVGKGRGWKSPRCRQNIDVCASLGAVTLGRNLRSVWPILAYPYRGDHYATFPPELVATCLLAGTVAGDLVLDPFHGAGTSMCVALDLGRRYIGVELSEDYCIQSLQRLDIWDEYEHARLVRVLGKYINVKIE